MAAPNLNAQFNHGPWPTVTGHLDGYCIRFGGEEVAVYPSPEGAAAGLTVAREALAMLAATLAGGERA